MTRGGVLGAAAAQGLLLRPKWLGAGEEARMGVGGCPALPPSPSAARHIMLPLAEQQGGGGPPWSPCIPPWHGGTVADEEPGCPA